MRTLFVLSHGRQTASNIADEMKRIFGKYIDVQPICVEDGLSDIDFRDALVLDTGKWTEELDTSALIPDETPCIRARRVVDFDRLHMLMDLPDGSDILLVNDHQKTADIAIKQLLELGITQLNLYPFYPGIQSFRRLSIAITPGEPHLVPDCVKTTIDIGTRKIDLTTLVEVAESLGILDEVAPTLSMGYVKNMFQLVKKYSIAAKDAAKMRDTFQVLADHSSSGIVYVDEMGQVVLINRAFHRLFGRSVGQVAGKPLREVIQEADKVFQAPGQTHILDVYGKKCVIEASDVRLGNGQSGMIINIEDADAIQRMEHELRRKSRESIQTTVYDFTSIHYKSEIMEKTTKLAKKLSRSDATVLLQGESGTGKELLAQAMHNFSNRKGGPFIPVNFAALPESLIESELFGYEDGAFTGAKKGGSAGLFEAAHGGTLFLDEIGDAPLSFQTRLLRVLQEKQVRRIGGRTQIPIDVRIMAATNKDLARCVDKGTFRQDLYYRLCVLPVEVPPLRARREDILLLLKMQMEMLIMKKVDLNAYLGDETRRYLENYRWPGNIRQLANLAEYLVHIVEPGDRIKPESLPLNIREDESLPASGIIEALLDEAACWVIRTLDLHDNMGRVGLLKEARAASVDIGEGKIRTVLTWLQSRKLVESATGRGGSRLTDLGRDVARILAKQDV